METLTFDRREEGSLKLEGRFWAGKSMWGGCPSETQSVDSIWGGGPVVSGEPCLAESAAWVSLFFAGLQGLYPLPGGSDFSVLVQGLTLD